MAFWGEALTYKHALWWEEDQAGARAALAKINRTHLLHATPREQHYVAAIDLCVLSLHVQAATPPARQTTCPPSVGQTACLLLVGQAVCPPVCRPIGRLECTRTRQCMPGWRQAEL